MSKLDEAVRQRRYFDVSSALDIKLVKSFFIKSAWGNTGCPFLLEEPFTNIPDMIRYKITNVFLGIENDKETVPS
jgi:hypothetical protein